MKPQPKYGWVGAHSYRAGVQVRWLKKLSPDTYGDGTGTILHQSDTYPDIWWVRWNGGKDWPADEKHMEVI